MRVVEKLEKGCKNSRVIPAFPSLIRSIIG